MRLMRRSHTLGRIDHGTFGGQAGADPTRVVAAMALPGYEVVKLPLMPGDVAFMHSNTLHASSQTCRTIGGATWCTLESTAHKQWY